MPTLKIIAGPNGAGKSTHSKGLLKDLKIEAFDLDKEFYELWSQFSFDPSIEEGAFARVQELYTERRSEALRIRADFAFETNYHTRQVLATLEMFRVQAYSLELIFICLENVEAAIERVRDRVAKGGHSVAEAVIHERFINGLKLLDESFYKYDRVYIYLSKYRHMDGLLVLEPPVNGITFLKAIPEAIAKYLPRLQDFVSTHRR